MYSAVFLFLALITHADDNFDCIECAYDDPTCEECAGRRQLSVDCIECAYDDPACEECAGRRQLSVGCSISGQYDDFSWYEDMESTSTTDMESTWMPSTTDMEITTTGGFIPRRRNLQDQPMLTLCNDKVPGYDCATNYKCVEVTDRYWENGANEESVACALCESSSETTEMETTTSMWMTSTEMESTEMETTTSSMWMTSTTEMESTTDMEFADCGEYEQLGNSRECFGKGAGCVGAGWFSKNNTGKIDATQVCLDQGYEGADPEQYGGNWGHQCRHPGNSLTHFNKAGGALTAFGMTVSWKCLGGTPQTDSDGADMTELTDCDPLLTATDTISEIYNETICLCEEYRAVGHHVGEGFLLDDREPLTDTLQDYVELLAEAENRDGVVQGAQFLIQWNRRFNFTYQLAHNHDHNLGYAKRIWRKTCRSILVMKDRMVELAERFD